MTDRIRTTISVSPEVHEIFKRMAESANMSVSRCMGDWLADTQDAANLIALKMEEARKAPMRVMKELKAMVAGMSEGVDAGMAEVRVRRQATAGVRAASRPGSAGAPAPSSNTGLKSPKKGKPKGQKL